MADTLNLLDQALDLGHKELKFLVAGEVEEAFQAAEQRGLYTTQALETKASVSLDDILSKLEKLKSLQGQLTTEAKKLHASVKADLGQAKKESVRFKGYLGVAKGTPIMKNRYIHKVG
ncbi:hypothetical protein [Maridesulfovibrio ferrireducens]|uniref:Uncharacterized protein n=1 Tax=Maridesulfovibrio ferrireducens TaxID=246191 RepID=A0A1G9J9Z8_9BACT|nr:hypothetical protein [Maridesulfovibrio ferrireducens]MBI9112131.1 hypothetical protein [Maridesulfovibrio ferrireducens]SDL34380.1 hypothetical protein SAMN05660337_2713 [Maridesulfovibrio ferrireducens]